MVRDDFWSFQPAQLIFLFPGIEPTSALDPECCLLVERFILDDIKSPETNLKAIVWITHSLEQAERVGTRYLQLSGGRCYEDKSLPV
jgi:ABC-type phosphate transport system ATPase subunit